ncbi:MAG: hypothetical protein KA140_04085 [Caldisericia bacterium]|nr:hypothetical protein [Caldisericia bacterium]
MRIRVRFVLIAIISLITMVPEFRIYSVSPGYTTKPIDAGRILESFDTADVKGSLVITHKGDKLNAYSDKMLDKLIASFEMPGEILDWQSALTDDQYSTLFFVLHDKEKTQYISIFKVNQYSDQIVLSDTFVVSGSEIINIYKDNGLFWITLQDGMNKINVYDLTGKKTCQIERKILNYVSGSGYSNERNLFVYDGKELIKYTLISGILKIIKSISSFDVNSSVQINDDYKNEIFATLLLDRKKAIIFDSDMNVLFSKQVPDVKGRKIEDGFLEVALGSMFVKDYRESMISFDAKGYKYKKVNSSDFEWPWYLYEGLNSFGLLAIKKAGGFLSPGIVNDFGFLEYIAFTGLPKDIQYVIIGSDEYEKHWIYAYTMKDIYMIPSKSSYYAAFSIKTINTSLPTNQNFLIDWGQYWICIAIIILGVLATGMINVILRLF